MFQMVEQAQKNKNNPMDMLKEITKNYSPEQVNGLFERARQFGVPDDVVKQAQEGINVK